MRISKTARPVPLAAVDPGTVVVAADDDDTWVQTEARPRDGDGRAF